MTTAVLALSAFLGAVSGALVPIAALILLDPADYGSFSTGYLVFAYGLSLQYSVVSEAWMRARKKDEAGTAWANYSTVLLTLSGAVAGLAAIVPLHFGERAMLAVVLPIAVFFGVYRSGARYHRMATGAIRRVIFSDVLCIIAFVPFYIFASDGDPLLVLSAAWAISGLISFAMLGLPRFSRSGGPLRWLRTHRREIVPLLSDSTLMDVGALGTPFLLAGFMGPHNFGLYRGVANTAMPVRLLLDPLRSTIGKIRPATMFHSRALWSIGCITVLMGAGCFGALEFLLPMVSIDLGTLSALIPFSAPAGVFVAASFLGTLFYVVCRNHSTRQTIMKGRLIQTAMVLFLPLIGFTIGGLGGAVWGFSVSALASGLLWLYLAALGTTTASS